jgi:hypothetical protein
MDIHKPKPWHGVREFLKEYAIIVIGVLTALGAEQAAEGLHGRHVIHEAEAAMRSELLDDDLPQAYVRIAATPCMAGDLKRLTSALDARIPPRDFGVLAKAYFPPIRTWDEDAWKTAGASGAASRMDGARLLRWSLAYQQIPFLQVWATRENDALANLSRRRFASGPWTPQRADELSDILDELQKQNINMASDSGNLLIKAKAVGLLLSPAVETRLMAETRGAYGDCVVKPNLQTMGPSQEEVTSPKHRGERRKALGLTEP